jgi:hypothetical protein
LALVGVGMVLGLLGGRAQAETRIIKLSGLDEVPVVITGAAGELRVSISNDEQTIEYTLSYAGLEGGDVLQAHIHLGQEHTATAGNIVLFLCTNVGGAPPSPPANETPACPVGPDGEVTGTLIPANVILIPAQGVDTDDLAAIIEAIRRGVAYVNIHTTDSPAGEIRANFRGRH